VGDCYSTAIKVPHIILWAGSPNVNLNNCTAGEKPIPYQRRPSGRMGWRDFDRELGRGTPRTKDPFSVRAVPSPPRALMFMKRLELL